MKKLQLEYIPIQLTCPYCSRRYMELADDHDESGAVSFQSAPNDRKQTESVERIACECGAEFLWLPANQERSNDISKDASIVTVSGTPTIKGYRAVAVKDPLIVRTYKLVGRKSGRSYAWTNRLIRIPESFKLIKDGAYIAFHDEKERIILQPQAKKK
jgi:hypothetical protein